MDDTIWSRSNSGASTPDPGSVSSGSGSGNPGRHSGSGRLVHSLLRPQSRPGSATGGGRPLYHYLDSPGSSGSLDLEMPSPTAYIDVLGGKLHLTAEQSSDLHQIAEVFFPLF